MTRVAIAPQALRDIERVTDFLLATDPQVAVETAGIVSDGLAILRDHPLIGRRAESGYRELLISRGRTGYIALYRYDSARDTVIVLNLKASAPEAPLP
ncbi:MAG: type II toxin-antitoxin system RelE/ParE family toxin [Betaproteobacteria bacterium]